jgi:hypothetical protein
MYKAIVVEISTISLHATPFLPLGELDPRSAWRPLALVRPLDYFSNICSNIHRYQGK